MASSYAHILRQVYTKYGEDKATQKKWLITPFRTYIHMVTIRPVFDLKIVAMRVILKRRFLAKTVVFALWCKRNGMLQHLWYLVKTSENGKESITF